MKKSNWTRRHFVARLTSVTYTTSFHWFVALFRLLDYNYVSWISFSFGRLRHSIEKQSKTKFCSYQRTKSKSFGLKSLFEKLYYRDG